MNGWEAVIGLEVHVQLRTAEKLFSGDSTLFGEDPNSQLSPVTLGLPGALPVLNREAVEQGIRAALGLGCTVHPVSVFARKNYFYPDLPKGYQISQFDHPLATEGELEVDGEEGPFRVRIRRVHLEEDAGKSLHDRFPEATAVDLNRAGVPLAEIVSEPDLRSPTQARSYLAELKRLLEYLDVSDCNMEEGSLRVDANVSIRPPGSDVLNTKTELKNMNSFSGVERALQAELRRQVETVEGGGRVEHQTLLWDAGRGEIRSMRSKEESHDYRYFPDPDLPPLVIPDEDVQTLRLGLPEFPRARERRFREAFGLPTYDAGVLTASRGLADYFEATVSALGEPKLASNWIMGPLLALVKERGEEVEALGIDPERLARLIRLVEGGTISGGVGKVVLQRMAEAGGEPEAIVEAEGLAQVRDSGALEGWVTGVLERCPAEVERFRGGEGKLLGFFMGEVMKASGGKADPKEVNRLLRERLG